MTAVAAEQAGAYAAAKGKQAAQRAGRSAARARIPTGNRQYQGIILAEYLTAILLVTFGPLASGGSPAAKAKNSPSPYDVNDMKQLVAISAVYFILALLSSGKRGRFAAWFGGLMLLAIGVSKTGQGHLSAVVNVIGTQPGDAVSQAGDSVAEAV